MFNQSGIKKSPRKRSDFLIRVRFISVETTVPTLAPRASAVRFEKRPKSLQSTFGTFFSQLI
jgi:hypothetical protein